MCSILFYRPQACNIDWFRGFFIFFFFRSQVDPDIFDEGNDRSQLEASLRVFIHLCEDACQQNDKLFDEIDNEDIKSRRWPVEKNYSFFWLKNGIFWRRVDENFKFLGPSTPCIQHHFNPFNRHMNMTIYPIIVYPLLCIIRIVDSWGYTANGNITLLLNSGNVMSVTELSTGHFSWTRPDPTRPAEMFTRPDPTRDCRQKVWPDPTQPAARPFPNKYSLQLKNYIY